MTGPHPHAIPRPHAAFALAAFLLAWFIARGALAVDALVLTGHYDPQKWGGLTLTTIKDGQATDARTLVDDEVFYSTFRPDGKQACYVRWLPEKRKDHPKGKGGFVDGNLEDLPAGQAEIGVVDLESGRSRHVAPLPAMWHLPYDRLYWSSADGGAWVYWRGSAGGGRTAQLWRVNVTTGKCEAVVVFQNQRTHAAGLARDVSPISGRMFMRTTIEDRSHAVLYEMSQGNGDLTTLPSHPHSTILDLSHDGRIGACVIGNGVFFVSFGGDLAKYPDGPVLKEGEYAPAGPTRGFVRNAFLQPGDPDDSRQKNIRGIGTVRFAANNSDWVIVQHWRGPRGRIEPGNWMDVVAYSAPHRRQVRISNNMAAVQKDPQAFGIEVAHDMLVLKP